MLKIVFYFIIFIYNCIIKAILKWGENKIKNSANGCPRVKDAWAFDNPGLTCHETRV